ncbi:type III-B CRISPR module RAMP protein Cmr4 [Moorellaceae bacterium AZ2]
MKSAVLGLLAETSLHPGVGQVVGAVDLPVARERPTSYPVIVGSSLKGSLRDRAEQLWGVEDKRIVRIFGGPDNAGSVLVTDARLLLLPVRSLQGHYKWVTCPYLLERLQRDLQLAGMPKSFTIPRPENGEAVTSRGQGFLFLEELSFRVRTGGNELSVLINTLKQFIRHDAVRDRLPAGLAIISDDEFAYFARYGLAVNARNVLDNETKTSQNLWYEETIPPDTLFYALLFARDKEGSDLDEVKAIFHDRPYLQVGGNETIGQGWCAVSWIVAGGEGK